MYSDDEVLEELRYLYRELQLDHDKGMEVFRIRMMACLKRGVDNA